MSSTSSEFTFRSPYPSDSLESTAYPVVAEHSLSRAIPTAETNIYNQQSLEKSPFFDRAFPSSNSRGTVQPPFALVYTAPSLVLNNGSPGHSEPTIKKKRKRADARQLEALNRMYARTAFPSTEERHQLAKDLDMSPRSVQIWLAHAFVYITCRISEVSAILSGSRTKGRWTVKPVKDVLILPFSPLWGKGYTTIRAATVRRLGMFYCAE